MEFAGPGRGVPRDPVGQVLTYEGHSKMALVDLGSDASDALRASWSTARPFESGGVIESAWLLPLLGAGSTTASSLLAGNVFLATANPATLMTIGSGLGSAVMGAGGIVAQAPFVAASSALIPVVAPVMLFTTVSSVVMGARLDRVQRSLGRLYEAVEGVRRVLDADATPGSRPPRNKSKISNPNSRTSSGSLAMRMSSSRWSRTKSNSCGRSTDAC